MTAETQDRSVSDGAPIECVAFIADHKSWFYSTSPVPITVDGDLYEPLPQSRNAIDVTSVIDTIATIDFRLPSDCELAQTFCYTISPKRLDIIIKRVQEGGDYSTDFTIEYIGEISGASADDGSNWASIKSAGKLQTRLNGGLSSIFYQRICNHVLFDVRCKVVKADFTESAIVTKIQGQIITVDNMVYPNGDLVGGEMLNTRTGETQSIVTNITNVLRIGYRFFDLIVGDTVDLTQGCDHARLGHCKNRYNNVPNYGGFDFVPEVNPFEQLNFQTIRNTTTSTRTDQQRRLIIPRDESGHAI